MHVSKLVRIEGEIPKEVKVKWTPLSISSKDFYNEIARELTVGQDTEVWVFYRNNPDTSENAELIGWTTKDPSETWNCSILREYDSLFNDGVYVLKCLFRIDDDV